MQKHARTSIRRPGGHGAFKMIRKLVDITLFRLSRVLNYYLGQKDFALFLSRTCSQYLLQLFSLTAYVERMAQEPVNL
jgi:hypothetical protein